MAFKLQKEDKPLKANGDLSGKGEYADYGRGKKPKNKKRKVYYFQEDEYHQDNECVKGEEKGEY